MHIPPRPISIFSTMQPSTTTPEYTYDAITTELTFQSSSLKDRTQFQHTIHTLLPLITPIKWLTNIYNSFSNPTTELPSECQSVTYLTFDPSVHRITTLTLACIARKIQVLNVITDGILEEEFIKVLRMVIKRELMGRYPAEIIDVEIVSDCEIEEMMVRARALSTTGEVNGEIHLKFCAVEELQRLQLDLVVLEEEMKDDYEGVNVAYFSRLVLT